MIRFGRIPFKIAKLVLDLSVRASNTSLGDISIDERNKSISEDQHPIDLSARPSMMRGVNTSVVNNTTFVDEGNYGADNDPQPINFRNPVIQAGGIV